MADFVELQKDIFLLESDIIPLEDSITDPPDQISTRSTSNLTNSIHPSKKNLIPQIFFATHNINGLRNDNTKLDHLLNYTAEHNIDIAVLTETNLPAQSSKYVDTKSKGYTSYWAGSDDKIKGSGVGIMIADHLTKFVHKVDNTSVPHYLVKITLCFKGLYLLIYGIYYPKTFNRLF